MQRNRQTAGKLGRERFFKGPSNKRDVEFIEVALKLDSPLEFTKMTDESGGDPYNFTGRFKRLFR